MLQTVKGRYREGRVELTEVPQQIVEAEVLITFLPQSESAPVPDREPSQPESLYGIWRGKIPADFDVEAALREIRSQSTEDWNH